MSRKDTSIAINGERREALNQAAVDITIATREPCKISVIVQHLIDNFLDEAVKDLKAKRKSE